jgi:uncharacterized repeat protein (TIGR03803 family)
MTLLLLGALLSWKALPPVRAQPVTFNEIYGFTSPLFHTSTRTNSDGINPGGVSLSGSTLYGTALNGGSWGYGTVFSVNTDGSGFTNLHNFTAPSPPPSSSFGGTNGDGANPNVGLVLWQNTLYGTAEYGGAGGRGTVFSVNTDGSDFSNLYSFPSVTYSSNVGSSSNFNSSGAAPFAGLVLSGGTLYGTAQDGGSFGNGTVFALILPGPALGIAPAGDQFVIVWPAWATNFVLQTAPDLTSGNWSNISSGTVTLGTNYVFTNTLTSQTAFFRLQQQ